MFHLLHHEGRELERIARLDHLRVVADVQLVGKGEKFQNLRLNVLTLPLSVDYTV